MVPPNDEEALAFAIIRASEDYNRAQEVGREGRRLVASRFSAELQSAKVVEFVRTLKGVMGE